MTLPDVGRFYVSDLESAVLAFVCIRFKKRNDCFLSYLGFVLWHISLLPQ